MTKADIVNEIAKNTGIDKATVLATLEAFMGSVKESLSKDENVYLRGFGSFIVKKRAQKTARNISKNIFLENSCFFESYESFIQLYDVVFLYMSGKCIIFAAKL